MLGSPTRDDTAPHAPRFSHPCRWLRILTTPRGEIEPEMIYGNSSMGSGLTGRSLRPGRESRCWLRRGFSPYRDTASS
jgi:hypothetical protein